MVSKVCAAWLALLVLLPFSAPFSTCDPESLFASETSDATHRPQRHSQPSALLADAATAHALPLTRTTERVKLLVSVLHSVIRRAVAPGSAAARRAIPPDFAISSFLSPLRI